MYFDRTSPRQTKATIPDKYREAGPGAEIYLLVMDNLSNYAGSFYSQGKKETQIQTDKGHGQDRHYAESNVTLKRWPGDALMDCPLHPHSARTNNTKRTYILTRCWEKRNNFLNEDYC